MLNSWFEQFTFAIQHDAPRFVLILLLIAGFGFLESIWPAQEGQGVRGRLRNMLYIALFFLLGLSFMSLLSLWLQPSAPVLQTQGVGTFTFILGTLFLSDLLFYWYHRFLHKTKWAWPIHELHHADTQLNATSSLRTYWFELPVQAVFIALPTRLLLGSDPDTQLLMMVITTTILFFTHANLRLHLGPFTKVIVGPQLHRIHHAIETQYQDKNFAQFFPIIDIIFCTYHNPGTKEFPKTGTQDLPVNASVGSVLMRPFKYWFRR
ncbi:MAG: sterol desaturase family protein [bacterium]|jgi:sterol desaturase/sphingolipid hydroxylase (fatty acid hydroxylase superfamily)|nr:sterol desaturase family protein [bacterium]